MLTTRALSGAGFLADEKHEFITGTVLWTGSITAVVNYRITGTSISTPLGALTSDQKVYISGLRGRAKLILDR